MSALYSNMLLLCDIQILHESCQLRSSQYRNEHSRSLGARYCDYENALLECNISNLVHRREQLCLMFAKSCIHSDRFSCWFQRNTSTHSMTVRNKRTYQETKARLERYNKSAIPYLTRLLNDA